MKSLFAVLSLQLFSLVTALPGGSRNLGISFENGTESALLKLDYATYRGTYFNETDIYVFQNIRFAAPPVGKLRWQKPAPPLPEEAIQNGTFGPVCTQLALAGGFSSLVGYDSEDCLFLDVSVPAAALRNPSVKLPVLDWIYGGAYMLGSKEQGASPQAMIKAANHSIIYVAGNYRVGAYGFLTGTTVEKQGVPNAGFWDQRAVLEWIQKYIHLVGGDKTKVTTMGISAGAGSIQHHLIAEGGKLDPLFTKAVLLSPGYMNNQDRGGQLEDNYKKFEGFGGCTGKGLDCLRALNASALRAAADKANRLAPAGQFTFNPGPDGKYIVNTPTLEFTRGRYWKNLDAIISSRVTDEGSTFAGGAAMPDNQFELLIDQTFGNSSEGEMLKKRARQLYPAPDGMNSPYASERQRVGEYITESSFTCHNRLLADGYAGKVYTVQYAVGSATHGSDNSAIFFNPDSPIGQGVPADLLAERMAYQSYFLSFVRSGNPNTYRNNETIEWPLSTGFDGKTIGNVLKFTRPIGPKGFSLEEDTGEDKTRCGFWQEVQRTVQSVFEKNKGTN